MSSALQENSLSSDSWGVQIWVSSRQLSIFVWTSGKLAILEVCYCCSVAKLSSTFCDPLDCSMPGSLVLHYLLEFAQCHAHRVSDAIQPTHPLSPPSSLALNLSQHQGLFQWLGSSHQVTKILQLQHQSFQWIFRVDFLWDWLVWSPCSPKDSQESSPAPQFESINSSALSLLYGPTLTSIHDYWEYIALTTWTYVGKVMSLLFNRLFRFVIAFLPRSTHLLMSWLKSPVIWEPKKIKSVTTSTFSPSICHEMTGPDAMIFIF